MDTKTVLLCGVGGQGTILAADILAKVAAAAGLKVKLSEVHGMAQRGGSVTTVVRFGEEVHSPVTDPGCVDALVSFEILEALRNAHFLKAEGTIFVNDELNEPMSVRIGAQKIENDPVTALKGRNARFIPATETAISVGSPRSANVVLLGALSKVLPFDEDLWLDVIKARVPEKTLEGNIAAFKAGRDSSDSHGSRKEVRL
jgi:indolepyruvate ferredoxin oxidoreductase beta subunit